MERFFRSMPLQVILEAGLKTEDGLPRVERYPYLDDTEVAIPKIAWGQTEPPRGEFSEWPHGGWDVTTYVNRGTDLFRLRDAVVHGEQGLITIDDCLVAESLYCSNIRFSGFEQLDEFLFRRSQWDNQVELLQAGYLMCGYIGNRNYAHWWIDIMTALQVPPFGTAHANCTLLMPKLRSEYQFQTIKLFPELGKHSVCLDERSVALCKELTYVPQLSAADLEPHPIKRRVAAEARRRVGAGARANRRIYVNRKDAPLRKLVNENAIIALVERHGFESMTLSELSVAQQIALFAEASHVIGAHGAGLVNVIFCQPGARLLELQMETGLVWTIRRAAALAGMTYGCLIGHVVSESEFVGTREWEVPLEKLDQALAGFAQ